MKTKEFLQVAAIVAVLAMPSCKSSIRPMWHEVYTIDYAAAGGGKVFITESNSVSFEYEPIGSILVKEHPGEKEVKVPLSQREIDYEMFFGVPPETKTERKYEPSTAQSALEYAANQTLLLGGDGIINLKLTSEYVEHEGRVVCVSGMVIKRK